MPENYVLWEPVTGVSLPCAAVVLYADPADVTVRLRFSEVSGNPGQDLLVRFGREVMACMSHDWFVHPWRENAASSEVPRLAPPWDEYPFPLVLVENSLWLANFSDKQLTAARAYFRHFRFMSLDNIVDVITLADAEAEWVPPVV